MGSLRLWPATACFAIVSVLTTALAAEPNFSGDVRVRYENTHNVVPGSSGIETRHREVARFRLGMTGKVNDSVHYGARLTTGDPNDPNSSDVTLGSFINDLTVSLDRAYVGLNYEGLQLTVGKFQNPFLKTDLVWDDDVNPQGSAVSYARSLRSGISGKAVALYSIIDEHEREQIPDSDMYGVQGQLSVAPSNSRVSGTVAGGYLDYHITSLSSADAGDIRANTVVVVDTLAGVPVLEYESDFDLVDLVGIVDWNKNSRIPVRVVGDYVKNLGSKRDDDDGFSVDVWFGKASARNDLRLRYGYAQVGKDAVLGAFSHDNTTIASNYRQHTVTLDFVALDNTVLNATMYWYEFKDLAGIMVDDEWLSRLRLNCELRF